MHRNRMYLIDTSRKVMYPTNILHKLTTFGKIIIKKHKILKNIIK